MGISRTKRSGKTQPIIAIIAVVVMTAMMLAGCSGAADSRTTGSSDVGVAAKSSIDEYSWDELSTISQAIGKAADENAAIEVAKNYNLTTSDGKLDGTQTKDVTLSDGTQTSVQIAGFYHDDKSDGSGKVGITFIFTGAIADGDMNPTNTNEGGWEKSEMRSWLSSEGMEMLPADLQSAIVAVDKLTNNVGETTSTSSVTKTSDRLWLFAPIELCGNVHWYDGSYSPCNDVLDAEGTQYKLYRDAGITDVYDQQRNTILEKTYDGSSCGWWGRSPDPYSSDYFYFVDADGNPYFIVDDYGSNGVVLGFCI